MTALVISSTNSGTPSVLAAISSSSASGRRLPRVMRATIACVAARASRFSARRVTTGWLAKEATKVGRAVISRRTLRLLHAIQRQLDQLQRRRIDPVRVFDHPQHRLAAGQPGELVDQGGKRAAAALLRGQGRRAIARRPVETHKRREQRCRGGAIVAGLREQRLEPLQSPIGVVVRGKAGGMASCWITG